MKPAYANLCPMDGDPVATAERAWGLVWTWLEGPGFAFPGPLEDGNQGMSRLDNGHTAAWHVVAVGDHAVGRVVHEIDSADEELDWRTVIWICRDGEGAWAVIRSGPQNRMGVITTLRFDAKRPRIVGDWMRELTVVGDGRRLGEDALNYGVNDAPALCDLLLDPKRRLPIVAISKGHIEGVVRPLLKPHNLSYRLAGQAHVLVLDGMCAKEVTEAIGKDLSVYSGGVRIWWPGLRTEEDPLRHFLVAGDRVAGDPRRAEQAIVRRVWQAAVDGIGPPPLESEVRRAKSRLETERRLDALRSEVDDGADWESWLEEQIDENEKLAEQVEELEAELESVTQALKEAQSQTDLDDSDDTEEVESVEEAVKIAAAEASRVVYLESAFESARQSKYPDPRQVLRDLRALNRVADRWAAGDLRSGFKGAFTSEAVTYRSGISQTARTSYKSDYEIDYGGQMVMMGPHLRRGVGAPDVILRIYWYADEATKQLVVGHVGKKLRDKGNS